MNFDEFLGQELDAIHDRGLYRKLKNIRSPQGREIRINGRTLLNFSSNDYLGLANHPALREAAIEALEAHGAGAGASRLLCGNLASHQNLDESIAAYKDSEAALSFSSGYNTAIGTICAVAGKDDFLVVDKLCHACGVDAARLSGARIRVFKHNDLNDLERIVSWCDQRRSASPIGRGNIIIATESIFSMDGDLAPLEAIVALKNRYGAWLMLDEAHATGLFGEQGRGLAQEAGLADQVEIQMGTLGKALGAAGGYICGSRKLIDFLINRARSFIFSTAPVPAAAAAAAAAIELVQTSEGTARRIGLFERIEAVAEIRNQWTSGYSDSRSPILPLILGDESVAMNTASQLFEAGLYIPAVRYPSVPRNQARLRLTLSAAHTMADCQRLVQVLNDSDSALASQSTATTTQRNGI